MPDCEAITAWAIWGEDQISPQIPGSNTVIERPSSPYGIQDAIALLVLAFAGIQMNILVMNQTAIYRGISSAYGIESLIIDVFGQSLIIAILVVVYVFCRARSALFQAGPQNLGIVRPTGRHLAIGLIGAFVAFTFSAIFIYALPATDATGFAMHRFLGMATKDRMLFPICIILLVPIAEELLYRGAVFAALTRGVGVIPASVVVTVIFVLSHYTIAGGSEQISLSSVLQLSALGVVLIAVRIRTGNLWGSLFAHCGYNVLCIVAALA